MSWQPIDTAPRDGQYVLLSDGQQWWVGLWVSEQTYQFGRLVKEYDGWRYKGFAPNGMSPTPTLWAPIPPLPVKEDRADG